MEKKKKYSNYIGKIKSHYKFVDGFALKYILIFFMISAATNITLKVIFHKEIRSSFTALTVMIIAIAVSLLWTKLALKVELSIFDYKLSKHQNKQALSRRGIAIVIYYLILDALKSEETSRRFIILFTKMMIEVSFIVCLITLIISFLILTFRRAQRPARR